MFRLTMAIFRGVVNKAKCGGLLQCFPFAFMVVNTSELLGISLFNIILFPCSKVAYSPSQWPRGLMRRSAIARLLRSWVRIPPRAWMFVCCECCVLSGRGLCDELITRPEESYRLWCVVVCDLENSWMRRPWPALGRSAIEKTNGWVCWNGDATDALHRVENYVARKLISGSGILLPTEKKRIISPNVTLWEVFTAYVLSLLLSCCLVGGYRLLGRTFRLDLDHEYWVLTSWHSVITHKTTIRKIL